MEYADAALVLGGLSIREDGNCSTAFNSRRTVRRRGPCDDSTADHLYKSKNLEAERQRRLKLGDRLLTLRALVPRITNMKKETIIEDAITYILELQGNVKFLRDELLEMETVSEEGTQQSKREETSAAEEMKKCGIKEDVEVNSMGGNKLQMKITFEKKRGKFTKLLEAIASLGFEVSDTSVTSTEGATLVSSFAEGTYGHMFAAEETRELLLKIIKQDKYY